MMCKRREYSSALPALASGGAYEGKTRPLTASEQEGWVDETGRSERRKTCGGFPWWTLWLIWPLMAALKSFGPAMAGAGAGLLAAIGGPASLPAALVAVALIVVGLALIRR